MTIEYLDQRGQPMSLREWARAFEDLPARTVDESPVRIPDGTEATVRTVWLGMVVAGEPSHRLFGTAVRYGQDAWQEVRLYDDKPAAQRGHREVMTLLERGERPTPEH